MMTDFDHRVRESLDAAADHSPDSTVSLVAGAQRRLRRRRTARGAVVAVVVVAVAVPVGVSLGHRSGGRADGNPPVIASDVPPPDVAAGWRTETWRDLTLQVPDSWGYGSMDQWCVGADGSDPVEVMSVQRPEGAQTLVLCQPNVGYGVRFFDPATDPQTWPPQAGEADKVESLQGTGGTPYPGGAWIGYQATDHAGALVVAPDRLTALRILSSVEAVTDLDPLGCPAQWDGSAVVSPRTDLISVCRYGGDGWLQQSDLLTKEESAVALTEIGRGPFVDGSVGCAGTDDTTIALGSLGVVTLTDQCPQGNQIALSGTIHELTERDLFWALSPGWSGGVDGSVPLPSQLRS